MKIVINKCFGGFGVSKEAIIKLNEMGCKHLAKTPKKDWIGFSAFWEKRFPIINGKVVIDKHRGQDRTCPHLIKVIEEMGDKADGECAKLKIIEIPDGVNFEIDDYDGVESVNEVHSSWG